MPTVTFIADHLWQSTLFAAVAAALALTLKNHPARIRYWIWLAASLKFIVPFAVLATLGHFIGTLAPSATPAVEFSAPLQQLSEPFAKLEIVPALPVQHLDIWSRVSRSLPALLETVWLIGFLSVFAVWALRWLRLRSVLQSAGEMRNGRLYDALHRSITTHFPGIPRIRLLSSNAPIEPGVVGILRPVLLVPDGIKHHLNDSQMDAIITHELCHVRRRDNFGAAIHMMVQALFWFHPLVWWIGSRLIDERERACDDEVVRLGNDPEAYAHGILTVCRFYLRSSLPCASGITSSNLTRRIEEIVSLRRPKLSLAAGALLVALAGGALTAPIVVGMVRSIGLPSQSPLPDLAFEVATVKRNVSADRQSYSRRYPGGRFTASNSTLHTLILGAYGVPDYLISGAPEWWDQERYDVEAEAPAGTVSAGSIDRASVRQFQAMQQRLLADRFKLKVHHQTKVAPIYTMSASRGGVKMKPSPNRDCMNPEENCHGIVGGPRLMSGHTMSIAEIADMLGTYYLDRPVRDQSGIQGFFDFELRWTPESMRGKLEDERPPDVQQREAGVIDPFGPDLLTALQEQLGLKLQTARGPVEVIVIDHVERLAENEVMSRPAPQPPPQQAPVPPQARPAAQFEAASIRPCQAGTPAPEGVRGGGGNSLRLTTGRLHVECMTAATLIRTAYGYSPADPVLANLNIRIRFDNLYGLGMEDGTRVRGGPNWARSEKFTIDAVGDSAADAETLRGPMLLALLESRFQLKAHIESEQIPGFAVVIAKGGLQVKPVEGGSCVTSDTSGPGRLPDDSLRQSVAALRRGDKPLCGFRFGRNGPNVTGVGGAAPLPSGILAGYLGVPVVDRTGIAASERFNYVLEFGLDDSTPGRMSMPRAVDETVASDIPPGPNIFTAMEQQLGLKLEPTKLPREYLVIDRLERPTPN